MVNIPGSESPQGATFWFVMSIALLTGAIIAYPINWWLVAHHLKHGMMTVRRPETAETISSETKLEMVQKTMADTYSAKPSMAAIVKMAIVSIAMFGVGIVVSVIFSGPH